MLNEQSINMKLKMYTVVNINLFWTFSFPASHIIPTKFCILL